MALTCEEMPSISSPRVARRTDKSQYKRNVSFPSFDSLPVEVQEEIECLYEFVPEVAQHFEVIDKIGEGTFSSVFLARLKAYPNMQQMFALKHIIPTSHPSRIEQELRCLQEIGGVDNVMGVELCLRNRDHVVIVMKYSPHEKFQDYVLKLSVAEVRDYIRNLLIALRRVHQFDIIHRDVKPSNFLYDRVTKQYALVDFGLAHKAPVAKKTTMESLCTPPVVSNVKKGVLTPSCTNQMPSFSPDTCRSNIPGKADSTSKDSFRARNYTPTLNFNFNKKSPRRAVLVKRHLSMAREKEDPILSQRKLLSTQGPSSSTSSSPALCQCFGKGQVCTICTARSPQVAPRAGTPGFRCPEVLMKCPDQTTAVDIWSAGVIFLSLISGRYPFFRANDDVTALAQIISLLGSEEVKESAKSYGKILVSSHTTPPIDFKTLCMKLRAAPLSRTRGNLSDKENAAQRSWTKVPDSAYHLLERLLDLNPFTRISAEDALKHPFFTEPL